MDRTALENDVSSASGSLRALADRLPSMSLADAIVETHNTHRRMMLGLKELPISFLIEHGEKIASDIAAIRESLDEQMRGLEAPEREAYKEALRGIRASSIHNVAINGKRACENGRMDPSAIIPGNCLYQSSKISVTSLQELVSQKIGEQQHQRDMNAIEEELEEYGAGKTTRREKKEARLRAFVHDKLPAALARVRHGRDRDVAPQEKTPRLRTSIDVLHLKF